ncbi:uncharacterized protein LOC141649693 [Silene latifolia]|uniref:uncharacterized protein LOC141649693 n=1 Tax=Silene latifolia TaxID=37657 RepID=UPI003D76C423
MSCLREGNPYAHFFRSLRELNIHEENRIVIRSNPSHDQRTHNTPTASQIATVWVEEDTSSAPLAHDIVVYACGGGSRRILHYYGCYDPLQYPVLFLYGETRWHQSIYRYQIGHRMRQQYSTFPINEVLVQSTDDLLEAEEQGQLLFLVLILHSAILIFLHIQLILIKKVSCREYYCYRLQIRITDTSILLRSGRLLQQYVVDMYIKLETTHLDFIRFNQKVIRAELYQGIIDSYNSGETHAANIGHRFILPASFIGCDRDMRHRYLNAMCLPEIECELLPHDEAQNRPDLVTQVFRAKLIELKKAIVKRKLFRNVAGYVYVVEFKKRGLPHAHFLIILDSASKIRSPEHYDLHVCAEIPDESTNPHLYTAVVKHMMHGPCGIDFPSNPCMRNRQCKNHYPRDFCDFTMNGRNSYPIYRRREDGRFFYIRESWIDNRWVVPYNPFLLARFDCHLNVEVCSMIKAVKYLYKYVYKGHDQISIALTDNNNVEAIDEISSYQAARWISPLEAAWRIFRFSLNEVHPNVVTLQVHLPNMQTVVFRPFEQVENVIDDEYRTTTMLTSFFHRNTYDIYARTLTYQQFPEHYVWHGEKGSKILDSRRKALQSGDWCTQILPKSFNDLLSINGALCSSFRDAAYRRGLLEADKSIEQCLEEACHYQLSFVLRRLFATLLIYCEPKSPRLLWDKVFPYLSEDFAHAFPTKKRKVFNLTLRNVCTVIESMGKSFSKFDFGGLRLDEE